MCEIVTTSLLTMFSGAGAAAGATAAGATAAAATTGGLLQTAGLLAGVGGTLYSGIAAARQGRAQARLFDQQAQQEAQLTATQDNRERMRFASQIRQQAAQLAARGVSLDSPTAVMLGQTAAQELAFGSQALRSGGAARQAELSNAGQMARAQARAAMLGAGFSAAGRFLTGAPEVWPDLLS